MFKESKLKNELTFTYHDYINDDDDDITCKNFTDFINRFVRKW